MIYNMTTEATERIITRLTDDELGASIADSWVILNEWHGSNAKYNSEVKLYNALVTEAERRNLR